MDISFKSVTHKACNGYPQSRADIEEALKKVGVNLIEDYKGRDVGLVYGYPHNIKFIKRWGCKKLVIFTMFESSKIPDDWIAPLKQADLIIVPCKFNQQAMKDAGFDAEVVPLGYNPNFFKYYKRPEGKKVYTFLHFDAYGYRKGWDITFKAFQKAFGPDDPVKLIFKTVFKNNKMPPMVEYPQIEWDTRAFPRDRLQMEVINKADCMVFPSRGEGFGHTPLEAMATGIPVMIPDGSGMGEYFDQGRFIELTWDWCDAQYDHYKTEDTGKMIACDVGYMARMMREIYNRQDDPMLEEWNYKNAMWVSKNWTYKQTANKLKSLLCG